MDESKKVIKEFRDSIAKTYFPQGPSQEMMKLLDKVESGLNATYRAGLVDGSDHLQWNNDSCLGFAVMAAVRIGMDEEAIKKLIGDILHSFNFVGPELAAAVYCNSKYKL